MRATKVETLEYLQHMLGSLGQLAKDGDLAEVQMLIQIAQKAAKKRYSVERVLN